MRTEVERVLVDWRLDAEQSDRGEQVLASDLMALRKPDRFRDQESHEYIVCLHA